MLACFQHVRERYYLCLSDTAGKNLRRVYPDTGRGDAPIQTIFGVDWSADGHSIAIDFLDTADRKIGLYDTATHEFSVLCDTRSDERDPRFSRDGTALISRRTAAAFSKATCTHGIFHAV
jgi:Tol biopolymer transport system component